MFTSPFPKRLQSRPRYPASLHRSQNGIVLVVALIMLVVISLLAAVSVRNATSSEGINANVRQTQLASQAAEIALRYCEDGLLNVNPPGTPGTATFNITSPPSSTTVALSAVHIQDYVSGSTPLSMSTTIWDSTASGHANSILIVPAMSVNHGITSTFSRPPECMIERLAPSTASTYSTTFNITARGFGPEVPTANASRDRPVGSVVWLQSTVEIQ